MRNFSVKLFRIWASGSGIDVDYKKKFAHNGRRLKTATQQRKKTDLYDKW